MTDSLPDVFTSLSKYHTIEAHHEILSSVHSDVLESVLRKSHPNPHLFGTAKRYLLVKNGMVIRDRLIDFIHDEGSFTPQVKMVMYFLFMFRDARYRKFLSEIVADEHGRWDTSIFRSRHTSYFPGAGGHKAFTNLRQLLFRTGILDENTLKVDMGDVQDWLPTALEIAAQHLPAESRARLIASPHGFLIRNKLNALVNSTPDELARYELGGTYEDATDLLPKIEIRPGAATGKRGSFTTWNRARPQRRAAKQIDFTADSIAYERATYQHWLLENLLAKALSGRNVKLSTNQLVDMLAEAGSEAILLEMKSCTASSMRAQIRRAISQLFEYNFLFRQTLPKNTHLCLVLERRPSGKSQWLLDYADFLGIAAIWKKDTSEELVCSRRAYTLMRRFGCQSAFTVDK